MMLPLEPILFGLLVVTALMVTVETNLFAAAMLTGVFSLISASLFVLMDAVDVAFTEASVGAGISTVLVLGTLALTGRKEDQQPARMFPFIVSLVVGATLVIGTLGMPKYGDPAAPIHNGTTKKILSVEFPSAEGQSPAAKKRIKDGTGKEYEGPRAVGLQNVVTSILASYRGYDTLGETAVIFTAGVGVMLLLMGRRRRPEDGPTERDGPPNETSTDTPDDSGDIAKSSAATADEDESINLEYDELILVEDDSNDTPESDSQDVEVKTHESGSRSSTDSDQTATNPSDAEKTEDQS